MNSLSDIQELELSKITCAADANVASQVERALQDMKLPEVCMQRAKQATLVERGGFLGLRSRTVMEENRATFFRFYVPREFELGVMRRVAEAADLYLPGRGSIYARDARLLRTKPLEFDRDLLQKVCEAEKSLGEEMADNNAVLIGIVMRGVAEELAETVLEMGRCVPLISFGKGMGLRNRLGLLRITLPIEKDVVYFSIPKIDAEWLEKMITSKARFDQPGQGILYRVHTRAVAVNLQTRRGRRQKYAASMEQVIAALDDLRGSNEWRRLEAKGGPEEKAPEKDLLAFSLIGEEGKLDDFVQAALNAGAGGATTIPLVQQDYAHKGGAAAGATHARESCDIIIPLSLYDRLQTAVLEAGFFASPASMIETTTVYNSITWAH